MLPLFKLIRIIPTSTIVSSKLGQLLLGILLVLSCSMLLLPLLIGHMSALVSLSVRHNRSPHILSWSAIIGCPIAILRGYMLIGPIQVLLKRSGGASPIVARHGTLIV